MEKIWETQWFEQSQWRTEEWKEFCSSRRAAVVFLGKLFAKVERVVLSPSEKQNDFAFFSERFN